MKKIKEKILVTGGAGFIGSHLVDLLIRNGKEVTVVDNLSTGKKENLNTRARFIKMDIRDKGLDKIFKEENYSSVFHLAAQMDVRKSVEDPLYDADINIMGGINLLKNCSLSGVENFIFASSGGVMYGECPEDKPSEDIFPGPRSPYGASKLAFEYYMETYRHNHGLRTSALRLANVYGPRQDHRGEAGVVAIFSGLMLKGRKVEIFGDGNQLRDYVYVSDVADAFMRAYKKGGGVYNIGTGVSVSVNTLFGIIKELTAYNEEPLFSPARRGELQASRMDARKAGRELGWEPEKSLREGLKETVGWFRKSISEGDS